MPSKLAVCHLSSFALGLIRFLCSQCSTYKIAWQCLADTGVSILPHLFPYDRRIYGACSVTTVVEDNEHAPPTNGGARFETRNASRAGGPEMGREQGQGRLSRKGDGGLNIPYMIPDFNYEAQQSI
jgi:hypothetical protein